MSENIYECMFIFDSNRYAKDPGAVTTQVNDMIANLGGTVRVSRLWNEQKLAYPIKGHRKGTYWLTYFRIDPSKIAEMNRACQLNENILRHLVLKIDPRLEETLVAHALGKKVTVDTEDKEAKAESVSDDSDDDSDSDETGEVDEKQEAAVVGADD